MDHCSVGKEFDKSLKNILKMKINEQDMTEVDMYLFFRREMIMECW